MSIKPCFVGASGYRSTSGRHLASPTRRLDNYVSLASNSAPQPSLGFVDEMELQNLLREQIESLCGPCSIVTGSSVLGISTKGNKDGTKVAAVSSSSDQLEYPCDLVVVADGKHSGLRQELCCSNSQHGVDSTEENILQRRGYTVFRGLTDKTTSGQRICEDGFQTWGPDIRFACVPTTGGNAWFVAVSDSLLSNLGVSSPADMDLGETTEVPVPLSVLKDLVHGWHEPVGLLLNDCDAEAVTGEQAVAFSSPLKEGLSGIYQELPVAFIGDAAHTLDPILAQGAGIAIEDACILAATIGSDRGASNINWAKLLTEYDNRRMPQVARLHHISNIAQQIGHISSPSLCYFRDLGLALIPSVVKGYIFDRFMLGSLGAFTAKEGLRFLGVRDPARSLMEVLTLYVKEDIN